MNTQLQGQYLVTVCARGGSKGLPGKNIRPLLGRPLIAHTIELARKWAGTAQVLVSTDSEEIASVARAHGAVVPFLRPADLASDSAGKVPAIAHALREGEKHFGRVFSAVMDLDPTSPIRTLADLDQGHEAFVRSGRDLCFSVVKARKNPYFNMVERNVSGRLELCKKQPMGPLARQAAPQVWSLNASIYFYKRGFLLSNPSNLWDADPEMFEMPPESGFDIDELHDFVVTEALMRHLTSNKGI